MLVDDRCHDLISLLLDTATVDQSGFVLEHPDPVFVPERIRAGLFGNRKKGGTGTLVVHQGLGRGQSQSLVGETALIIRKLVGSGRTERLDWGEDVGAWIYVGRTSQTDVMVNDFSVSKVHARLRRSESYFEIEDLDSSNGTFINDERLTPRQGRELKSGDLVRFGRMALVFLSPDDLFELLAPSIDDTEIAMGRALEPTTE